MQNKNIVKADLLLAVFFGSEDPKVEAAAAEIRAELKRDAASAYNYSEYIEPCRQVHIAVDWYIRGKKIAQNSQTLLGNTPVWPDTTDTGRDTCLYCGTDTTDLRVGWDCYHCGGN